MLTRTRDTAVLDERATDGRTAADVEDFPDVRDDATSGGPTHTGRLPARLDPADGPDAKGKGFAAVAAVDSDAVALCAAGHDVGGAW